MEVHGGMKPNDRDAILKNFKANTDRDGPRVLIISPFAITGLNIDCASILILLVKF